MPTPQAPHRADPPVQGTGPPPGPPLLQQWTPRSFDNGARGRFNAWFFRSLDGYINHMLREHKDSAFQGLRGPVVVELGAGTGSNWARVPTEVRLLSVEPNVRMHRPLLDRADRLGRRVELVPALAEELPFEDGSVDEVLCSLVLCTVSDVDTVLAEVRRVLRPGGRFRFVEHVAAPSGSPRRRLQDAIRVPWGWVFEGCDPGRDTIGRLRAAGFSSLTVRRQKLRHSVFFPVSTGAWGLATR